MLESAAQRRTPFLNLTRQEPGCKECWLEIEFMWAISSQFRSLLVTFINGQIVPTKMDCCANTNP